MDMAQMQSVKHPTLENHKTRPEIICDSGSQVLQSLREIEMLAATLSTNLVGGVPETQATKSTEMPTAFFDQVEWLLQEFAEVTGSIGASLNRI